MGVSKNMGKPPNHPFKNRGFPLFSPSILVVFPLFWNKALFSGREIERTFGGGRRYVTVGFIKNWGVNPINPL